MGVAVGILPTAEDRLHTLDEDIWGHGCAAQDAWGVDIVMRAERNKRLGSEDRAKLRVHMSGNADDEQIDYPFYDKQVDLFSIAKARRHLKREYFYSVLFGLFILSLRCSVSDSDVRSRPPEADASRESWSAGALCQTPSRTRGGGAKAPLFAPSRFQGALLRPRGIRRACSALSTIPGPRDFWP